MDALVQYPRAACAAQTGPPAPPLIVPLLVSVLIVPEFDDARAAGAAGAEAEPPFPPLIVPLLVSVLIVPEFDDARAARPTTLVDSPGSRRRRR